MESSRERGSSRERELKREKAQGRGSSRERELKGEGALESGSSREGSSRERVAQGRAQELSQERERDLKKRERKRN